MRVHTHPHTGSNCIHTTRCSSVKEYSDQYETQHRSPEEITEHFDHRCLLCKLEITETDMAEFDPTERALDVFDHFVDRNGVGVDSETHLLDPPIKYNDVLDALRRLISVCQNKIHEKGYLRKNEGISVNGISHWKSQRKDAIDSSYFKTVPHGVAVCLIFDIVHGKCRNYESLDNYLDDAVENGNRCDKNMAKTYAWLKSINQAPHADRLNEIIKRYHNIEVEAEHGGLFSLRAHGIGESDDDGKETQPTAPMNDASLDDFEDDAGSEADTEKVKSPTSPTDDQSETTTATLDSF